MWDCMLAENRHDCIVARGVDSRDGFPGRAVFWYDQGACEVGGCSHRSQYSAKTSGVYRRSARQLRSFLIYFVSEDVPMASRLEGSSRVSCRLHRARAR